MSSEPQPKIIVDEDWKTKVEQERIQQESKPVLATEETKSTAEHEEFLKDPQHLPPADFQALLQMLVSEAMVSLGVWPHPADNKPHFLPNLAKHFVDLIAVLEQKTRGNLSPDEAKAIEQVLHQLRMTYVSQLKMNNK